MAEFFKKEHKIIFLLLSFFLFNLCFFFLKQGSLTVDVGREFYIPWQMLKGHVLYKDIFNIYGPLSYQINALIYMAFGQKISSLALAGAVNSFVVLTTIFYISREFLNKTFSLLITAFTLYACVFSVGLFNFNLPYSFAIIYSFSSFLLSVLFLIKYSRSENPLFAYISCLLAGFSVSCKYEYVLYPFLIAYVVLFLKPLGVKNIIKCLGVFCFFPIVSFGSLFLQGVNVEELKNSLILIKKMSQTDSINHLYTYFSGTYFNKSILLNVVKSFIYLLGVFFFLFSFDTFRQKAKENGKKTFYGVVYVLGTLLAVIFLKLYLGFGIFPILLSILFLSLYKVVIQEPSEFILYTSAILSSLKTFFALNLSVYGVFTIPLLLVGVIVFLVKTYSRVLKSESIAVATKTSLLFLLSAFVLYFAFVDYSSLQYKSARLETAKGSIYGGEQTVATYKELIEFVETNTSAKDKVVILPETPFVNFLTDRDSDNIYHSLIPLYFETFGEQNIIDKFDKTRPEYIVITNRDTSDYGKKYICEDYGIDFCSYVKENYTSVKMIENKYSAEIYRRKDIR